MRLRESRAADMNFIFRIWIDRKRRTYLSLMPSSVTQRSSTIAGDLAGGALVIADVEFLDVAEFGAGLRGSGDFGDEDTVSVKASNKIIFH